MARRETVIITDDLDGSEGAETVTFALQGTQYEIDLSQKNADKLAKALQPYLNAARKVGGASARRSSARRSPRGGERKADTAAIRAWAREHGYEISERGRIPQSVRDEYHAAH